MLRLVAYPQSPEAGEMRQTLWTPSQAPDHPRQCPERQGHSGPWVWGTKLSTWGGWLALSFSRQWSCPTSNDFNGLTSLVNGVVLSEWQNMLPFLLEGIPERLAESSKIGLSSFSQRVPFPAGITVTRKQKEVCTFSSNIVKVPPGEEQKQPILLGLLQMRRQKGQLRLYWASFQGCNTHCSYH